MKQLMTYGDVFGYEYSKGMFTFSEISLIKNVQILNMGCEGKFDVSIWMKGEEKPRTVENMSKIEALDFVRYWGAWLARKRMSNEKDN